MVQVALHASGMQPGALQYAGPFNRCCRGFGNLAGPCPPCCHSGTWWQWHPWCCRAFVVASLVRRACGGLLCCTVVLFAFLHLWHQPPFLPSKTVSLCSTVFSLYPCTAPTPHPFPGDILDMHDISAAEADDLARIVEPFVEGAPGALLTTTGAPHAETPGALPVEQLLAALQWRTSAYRRLQVYMCCFVQCKP